MVLVPGYQVKIVGGKRMIIWDNKEKEEMYDKHRFFDFLTKFVFQLCSWS